MNDRFALPKSKRNLNFTWMVSSRTNSRYDLTNDDNVKQDAITYFHRLQDCQFAEFNNKPTSRYCLVRTIPRNLVYAPVGISNIFSSGSRHGLQNNSFEQ
jgi:tRNA pseudouridine65 synthase